MNKLELITELKRLALILETGEKALPKRTPAVLRQAAAIIEDGMKKKKTTPLCDIGLSVRAYNALYRLGIRTLEDLKPKSLSELMRIPGLGAGSAAEIYDTVERYTKGEKEE